MAKNWTAIVLAAGRGPNDPMAKAYGVSHKCALPVAGVPMLRRVAEALRGSQSIASISVSIETAEVARTALGKTAPQAREVQAKTEDPKQLSLF